MIQFNDQADRQLLASSLSSLLMSAVEVPKRETTMANSLTVRAMATMPKCSGLSTRATTSVVASRATLLTICAEKSQDAPMRNIKEFMLFVSLNSTGFSFGLIFQ